MNRTPVWQQAGPDDADRIRAFVSGLSPRSQFFRFFASVAPPSAGLRARHGLGTLLSALAIGLARGAATAGSGGGHDVASRPAA